jgi:magnesium chelatase family protein
MARRNPLAQSNGQLPAAHLQQVLQLETGALDLWERALTGRQLSPRGSLRVLRVARTISDLAGLACVTPGAIAEALLYRSFDLLGERLPGEPQARP